MAAVIIGGAAALAVQTAEAARPDRPGQRARRQARRSFQLFQGANTGELAVNRVYCGMDDVGQLCTDVTGSPILGGGSWPRGTPDQYVFNTGIQIAGIIPTNAGFAWAGDTVGAWSIDTRGPAVHMQAISGVYSSLVPDHVANWPTAAYANDPTLFNPALLGRPSVSQQDTWMRYWDGSTTLLTGRRHTMGILIEQRTMAWNFPTGNEDLVYVMYRFTNITARASSGVYQNLAQYGYTQPDIDEIAALGDQFQNTSEAAFNVQIPDGGYTIGNTYVAFTTDMDVGDAGNNYASAILPFSLGITWKADWREPAWQFPSNIFSPPFAAAPGFVGTKYLKSPINPNTGQEFGITIFSTYTNPSAANSPFPDPLGIYQGYRYISGTPGPTTGDQSCQFPPARRLCFLTQAPSDQRFMQSSGPFSLAPGQSEVVVVAFVFAPVLQTLAYPGGTFDLGPYIGVTTLLPGTVPEGRRLFSGLDTLRLLDRAVGWISHADANGDTTIDQTEVLVARGSLLDKSLVAQAVFDNQFLLPFAPDAPEFYLIPSNNQVTVVWQTTPTETAGDPYFVVASDPTSALYDPNFRQYDVEGYRIWRGRSPANLEMVAQYDYAGTVITDYTGTFYNADYNDATTGANMCAPELGITASCPAFPHDIDLADGGPAHPGAVQIPAGGRVELANGTVLITIADTAVSGGGSGFPALVDNGVPFAFVDNSVRNGYRYFYSVTAFDVNSLQSGPSSLSSPLVTKSVTPRAGAVTEETAFLIAGMFGADTVPLNPETPWTLDAATGRFLGPPPPTNGLAAAFAPVVQQLLPAVSLTATIDSLVPHSGLDFACGAQENALGSCFTAYLTFDRDGQLTPVAIQYHHSVWSAFGGGDVRFETPISLGNIPILADSASAARFGIPNGFVQINATIEARFEEYIRFSAFEGQHSRRAGSSGIPNLGGGASVSPGGSRWFDGADETVDHPGAGIRVGHLSGVDTVWAPIHHTDTDPGTPGNQTYGNSGIMQCFGYGLAGLARQADVKLYWGAGGVVDSIVDVTHRVPVIFKPTPQASYGFFGDANGDGVTSWEDSQWWETSSQMGEYLGFCNHTDPGPAGRVALLAQPVIGPTSTANTQTAPPATGTGFGLYINGERYIFELTGGTPPSAGTVWTLRTYAGMIRASTGAATYTPSGYAITTALRPPIIPGLRIVFNVPAATAARNLAAGDLERVHTVPDPYYVTNNAEITTNTKVLRFINMPPQAIVRIYSVSGILVNVLTHNDAGLGGELTWNLRNRNNQFVASGVYFYHLETPTGETKVGRFTVVNYAQ